MGAKSANVVKEDWADRKVHREGPSVNRYRYRYRYRTRIFDSDSDSDNDSDSEAENG